MPDRREFIKSTCNACIGLIAFGSAASLLNSCSPLLVYNAIPDNNVISIPLTEIVEGEKIKRIRCPKLNYDILLVLNENKNHVALLMRCTHANNQLLANKNGLSCEMHGSTFNLNGDVTNGPAQYPLQKFKTIEEKDHIYIYLN